MSNEKPRLGRLSGGVIHLGVGGRTVCGQFRGELHQLPEGHVWVRKERSYLVNCPRCQRLVPEILAKG